MILRVIFGMGYLILGSIMFFGADYLNEKRNNFNKKFLKMRDTEGKYHYVFMAGGLIFCFAGILILFGLVKL